MPYLQQKSSKYVYIVFEHDELLILQIKVIPIIVCDADQRIASPCQRQPRIGEDFHEDSLYLASIQMQRCWHTEIA